MRMSEPDADGHRPPSNAFPGLTVTAEETGMKLLRFLERRLPEFTRQNLLHKWIRTGQVRVNGKRSGPFTQLNAQDLIRIPPFALQGLAIPDPGHIPPADVFTDSVLTLAAVTDALLVLNKAGGLPVQPGTGHEDSVVLRLQKAFAGTPYVPAPAHRLDRHTSGLLLAGRTHAAQKTLHRLLAEPGAVTKEYLAWVQGAWPYQSPRILGDTLGKTSLTGRDGREGMAAFGPGLTLAPEDLEASLYEADRPNAFCLVMPLRVNRQKVLPHEDASLLLVRLLTGRTHQIRVQLASRGFPIIGDGRYNGPRHPRMLLHAWRIRLPSGWAGTWPGEREFTAPPAWKGLLLPKEGEAEQAAYVLDQVAPAIR